MSMQRWNPRYGMSALRPTSVMEDMERRMEDIFGRAWMPIYRRMPQVEEDEWMPAIDVYERGDMFVVKAELPGISEDAIDVSVAEGDLMIRGEKRIETEIKEEDYYRCERTYGSFFRSVPLPANVDAEKVEASFENGVLEVTIPRMAEAKPKKVKVAARKTEK